MSKRVSKEVRRKRAIRIVWIVVIVLAILAAAIAMLRKQVASQVNADSKEEVQTANVSRGSISTTVSGSGNLSDEDVDEIKLHGSVEVDEIHVEAGDAVEAGDLLADVNMSTVLSAMSDIQTQLNDLDDEIGEASGDELEDTIAAAIAGRVMKIYAEEGDDVSTVMYENGALALLSLDGYMAVSIQTDALASGDAVTVTASDGTTFEGAVDTADNRATIILIPDEDAVYGDAVTVTDSEGNVVGSGELYIHEMMKITGIAGTIKKVHVTENQKIRGNKSLFALTDVSFSANYNSLLEERTELEEQLQRLIKVYQDGAVLAPISGIISSVASDESSSVSGQSSYTALAVTQTAADTSQEQMLLSICPGTQMTVSISVDESDILSLQVGQTATVRVDALGDETVTGTVSEIDTTASSSGGVTVYTVSVSFAKTEKMLSGMSASAAIVIEGVEDALLIPSDALTQTSASSYVYTGYNEETGELGSMIEVSAGMNNGEYVEITQGLKEGDTVYYFEKEESGFNFGGMNFGGGMPGGFGGDMPGGFGAGAMPNGGSRPNGGGMPGGFGN